MGFKTLEDIKGAIDMVSFPFIINTHSDSRGNPDGLCVLYKEDIENFSGWSRIMDKAFVADLISNQPKSIDEIPSFLDIPVVFAQIYNNNKLHIKGKKDDINYVLLGKYRFSDSYRLASKEELDMLLNNAPE